MSEDPRSIGRYLIQSALGRGAMGAIYKAHDPDIDRPVAIKLIRADLLASEDRDAYIARFRREAQAAGRCTHPNIVALYDFALHEGNPYLAMEFVDGVTLSQARPARGAFAVGDAVLVLLQVLAALQAAHDAGIVHRDVKPANILLLGGTRVKMADFGIARMNTANLTLHGDVIGTPSYMAPEQCRGEDVDARADIFAAGIVLFEMLAGHKPFRGEHAAEVLAKIMVEPTPDLLALAPQAGASLCAVVAKAMAKSASDRYASANEMAQALKQAALTSGTDLDDCTIVVPPGRRQPADVATAPSNTTHFDAALLSTLSRKLAGMVGPIATYLVHSAVQKAGNLEELCAELESKLEQPNDRAAFHLEVERQLARAATTDSRALDTSVPSVAAVTAVAAQTVPSISSADLDRVQTALARHMGPMARVMVKRAAVDAKSLQALKESLAKQIVDARDRDDFLRC